VVPFGDGGQGGTEAGPSEEERRRTQRRVLSFALSEDGAFIRELLVEEVAKVRPRNDNHPSGELFSGSSLCLATTSVPPPCRSIAALVTA